MTSKQRIKEYQGQLHELLNASGELDNVIIERTKKLIRELKDAIIARTVEISARSRDFGGFEPEWGPYWMSRLVSEYNMVIQDTSEKFKKDLSEYTIKAYEIGSDIADKGLDFENPGASATVPKLTTEQMRLASQFPGDMITGMQEKQLAAITKVLSFSMSRGEGAGKFMARISGKISKGPWSDTYYRAEVIARTETARIQELARKQRSIVQGRAFPGIQQFSQYLCEPRGIYPCKKCEQYDGNVYDAFGKLHIQAPGRSDEEKMPELPLHPNCFPGNTLVSKIGEIEAVYRRWYSGELLSFFVSLPSGKEAKVFSVTPNHPILSDSGLVPASDLYEGCNLIGRFFGEDAPRSASEVDVDHPETSIEQVFMSASRRGLVKRAVGRADQFHGDGSDEDVEIVLLNGELRDSIVAPVLEPLNHGGLAHAGGIPLTLPCQRCLLLGLIGSSSPGNVSAILESGFGISEGLSLEAIPELGYTHPFERVSHGSPTNFFELRDSKNGQPFFIKGESASIVRIERFFYEGHVYNLQTSSGHYLARDIKAPAQLIVGNCLCSYVSYIPGISRNPQEGKPDDPIPVDNLAVLKWNESLGVWSLKLPFDHGFRTISTLPKNSQYDELKAAANRLILETGLQLEEIFLEIMLPGEMTGPSQDPDKKRNERAVDSVIGQKLSKDLLDSPRSLRPSEEDL